MIPEPYQGPHITGPASDAMINIESGAGGGLFINPEESP
jgi:hypothetical protein